MLKSGVRLRTVTVDAVNGMLDSTAGVLHLGQLVYATILVDELYKLLLLLRGQTVYNSVNIGHRSTMQSAFRCTLSVFAPLGNNITQSLGDSTVCCCTGRTGTTTLLPHSGRSCIVRTNEVDAHLASVLLRQAVRTDRCGNLIVRSLRRGRRSNILQIGLLLDLLLLGLLLFCLATTRRRSLLCCGLGSLLLLDSGLGCRTRCELLLHRLYVRLFSCLLRPIWNRTFFKARISDSVRSAYSLSPSIPNIVKYVGSKPKLTGTTRSTPWTDSIHTRHTSVRSSPVGVIRIPCGINNVLLIYIGRCANWHINTSNKAVVGHSTQSTTVERREAKTTDSAAKSGSPHVGAERVASNDVRAELADCAKQGTFQCGVRSLLAEAGETPASDEGVLCLDVGASGTGSCRIPCQIIIRQSFSRSLIANSPRNLRTANTTVCQTTGYSTSDTLTNRHDHSTKSATERTRRDLRVFKLLHLLLGCLGRIRQYSVHRGCHLLSRACHGTGYHRTNNRTNTGAKTSSSTDWTTYCAAKCHCAEGRNVLACELARCGQHLTATEAVHEVGTFSLTPCTVLQVGVLVAHLFSILLAGIGTGSLLLRIGEEVGNRIREVAQAYAGRIPQHIKRTGLRYSFGSLLSLLFKRCKPRSYDVGAIDA